MAETSLPLAFSVPCSSASIFTSQCHKQVGLAERQSQTSSNDVFSALPVASSRSTYNNVDNHLLTNIDTQRLDNLYQPVKRHDLRDSSICLVPVPTVSLPPAPCGRRL